MAAKNGKANGSARPPAQMANPRKYEEWVKTADAAVITFSDGSSVRIQPRLHGTGSFGYLGTTKTAAPDGERVQWSLIGTVVGSKNHPDPA